MDIIILRQVALMVVVAVGLVLCEPPLSTQYGVPDTFARNNGHGTHGDVTNSYGVPLRDSHDINQDYIDNQPKSYEFGYAVKDVATGNDFGRRETSDGETVRGEYRVQLPDGRTQIVTYTADWKTGFHADVRYEGTAVHPEQYNTYNNNGHDYDYHGNNVEASYSTGSNSGYNGYNGGSGNYNSGFSGNDNNNYHFGTNSVDNSYSNFRGLASDSFDSKSPLPTYGTPSFH